MLEGWNRQRNALCLRNKISRIIAISLLNVEGKIFLAVLANRLSNDMVRNKNINTFIPRLEIQGFSRCLKHTSLISSEARKAKNELLWSGLTKLMHMVQCCKF